MSRSARRWAVVLIALGFGVAAWADAETDAVGQRIAQTLAVEAGDVSVQKARSIAHLTAYPFTAKCPGYKVRGAYAKALERIIQVQFEFDADFEPDPRWADLAPSEALTVHLRSLGMAIPKGVRLAKQRTFAMGSLGDRVSLQYERTEGSLAPLWLDANLNAKDHRPFDMTAIDYPLTVDTTPKVPEETAVTTARKAAGAGAEASAETRLRVWFDEKHRQVLWWDVRFSAKGDGGPRGLLASVTVDAHTGKVAHVVPFEGRRP